MRSSWLGVLLCAVVGCGSSAKQQVADPQEAEREAAAARAAKIEAMKPADPYEVRDRKGHRPAERCGQGPYRLETDSLRAKYGERLVVYACGKHRISGNYRLTRTREAHRTNAPPDEAAFGWSRDNQACKGREVAVVTSGGGGTGGTAPAAAGGKPARGATSAVPAKTRAVALEATASIPEDCVRTHVLDYGWTSSVDGVAVNAHFTLELWSDEPNDLEGLSFVVERRAVVADMTLDRWRAYRAAYDAWYTAYRANLDGEVRAGRTTLVERTVKTPPPPPPRAEAQPPRPSRNARWIPGYWHYEDASFHWIAGLWDVPEEDIRRELTVAAPTPPPAAPAHDEPAAPAPTRTAVWTPGSWQWDGRAYVWVAGAWRIPPDARHTWQRPTWNVGAGRAVFVPGGWRVRVRVGR